MMVSLKWIGSLAVVAGSLVVSPAAFAGCGTHKDIVDTAVEAGSFKTLAAALQAANLVDALKGAGPFTVFAPTDDAFARLPQGMVETLLQPENRGKLSAVLTYHVVSGKVPASKVVDLAGATTLNGQRVDIQVKDGNVMVDGAKVVKTDIECSNGIIHVIDNVIVPVSDDIPTVATNAGNFETLLAAAKAAGLVGALSGTGPLTVFAPTDDAFARLPAGTVKSLLKPENKDKLAAILKYHVIPGRVYSETALSVKEAGTLLGQNIRISASGGEARINDARLLATDLDASNGVIHVIDSVLIPSDEEKVSRHDIRQMIEQTVARGSRMFNNGHHEGCANLYTEATRTMIGYGEQMPTAVMTTLTGALDHAEGTHCSTQRAWTLRHGLDRAYSSLAADR